MANNDIAELTNIIASKDFDALAVYNDPAELSMALNDLGINILDDIKICSFDDVKYAKLLKTPLTIYRQLKTERSILNTYSTSCKYFNDKRNVTPEQSKAQ